MYRRIVLAVDPEGLAESEASRLRRSAFSLRPSNAYAYDWHVPRIRFQSPQNRSDFAGRQANLSDDSSLSGGLRPRCSQV